jgi:hypothetical protein
MNIKEPEFLQMFGKGKSGKKSYTPAELAKQYDIEKYRKILQDPDSDHIDRKTAELMIKNYQTKLAALALVQEGKKGFPQGMPAVAQPMTAENQYTEETFVDPSIKQFESKIDDKIKQAEEIQNTEEQDPDFAQQYAQAEEMNEGQPIAQPTAQYGMSMGGYTLPFAQLGIELDPTKIDNINYDRNQPGMQEYLKAVQKYNELKGKTESIPVGEGPLNKDQIKKYNDLIEEINPKDHGTYFDPETGEPLPHKQSTPENYLEKYKKNLENCPCMKKVIVQGVSQKKCVPCEQLEMAQYGMAMGGYDFPYEEDIPEAEYGMAMGANPRNYMGRSKSPMYARGGALRTYQGDEGASSTSPAGGAPAADGTLDVTGLDPETANKKYYMWKERNKGQEPKIMLNGKPAKYTPPSKKENLSLSDLKAISDTKMKYLRKEFSNPKSEVRKQFLEKTREALQDRDVASPNIRDQYKKKTPNDQQLIDGFLNSEERADKIKQAGIETHYLKDDASGLKSVDEMVKSGVDRAEAEKKLKEYKAKGFTDKKAIAKNLGVKIHDDRSLDTGIEQAAYHGIARMQQDKKAGKYDKFNDDDTYAMHQLLGKGVNSREVLSGAKDNPFMAQKYGDEYKALSAVEGYSGNTQLGQSIYPAVDTGTFENLPEEKKEEAAAANPCPECIKADGSKYVPEKNADGTCPPCEEKGEAPAVAAQETEPEMWLQDKMKIAGAFGDLMGAKKYMPWAAKYDLKTPKPTFLDPTRELAANAEQANIQSQALAQFAGPQALSARASGVMGAASKNAADVMAKYNNANVNLANQFETNIANVENQEQQLNTAAQQKLYDQNTISNQQYDNTKRALRNNLLNQTTSGITNMMKTDALNQLYPQYQVDAPSGGRVTFDETKAKQVKPEMSGDNEQAFYEECSKRYKDEPTIQRCVSDKMKNAPSGGGNSGRSAFDAHNAKEGGFVYGDVTYPFIL